MSKIDKVDPEKNTNASTIASDSSSFNHKREEEDDDDENDPTPLETKVIENKPIEEEDDDELVREYTHSVADIGPNNESTVEQVDRLSRSLTNTSKLSEKYTTPLPQMGGGRPFPPELPNKDDYMVTFDGPDDPRHPFNWSFKRKAAMFVVLTLNVITVTFGSSIFSTAIPFIAKQYGIPSEVCTLGITFYVLGFALGPIAWAPLSELYGRKIILVVSTFIFTCFTFGTATAKDIQTILITRFFAGAIGSAPTVVVGGSFADMFDNRTRGYAIGAFSLGVVLGPQLAPIIGGFVSNSYLGWRWTEYLTGILGSVSTLLLIFVVDESHYPVLLTAKAEELRRRTGIWGIRAAHEEFNLSFSEIVEKNVTRPVILLFTEPILFLITIYVSLIYGIIYLCLTAYPIIFGEGYGWKGGITYLPYVAMIVGQILGSLWILYCEKEYIRQVDLHDGNPVPEARLPAVRPGAFAFPIGLLWLCWAGNYPDKVPWPAPACAGLFIGFGVMSIYLPCLNYIVDSYLIYAASAMAANSIIRSIFGAVFPLFATYMFHGMGTGYAGLLLGLFSLALAPVPFLFMRYGKQIRRRSKYAFD